VSEPQTLRVLSAADLLDFRRTIRPDSEWQYDVERLVLVHNETGYEVDLERMRSSAEMLDWIFQIRPKRWVTSKTMADLLEALEILLEPQAHYCGCGRNLRPKVTAILARYGVPRGAA
jgi:hypothetical protein